MSKARELADVIGTQDTTENVLQGRRNLIINGDFQVSQRGNYSSATSISGGNYYLDRWYLTTSNINPTLTHSTVVLPNGQNVKSQKVTATTAAASGYAQMRQKVENYLYLRGQTVTLSAWVRTNKGDVHNTGLALYDNVNGWDIGDDIPNDGNWHYVTHTVEISTTISTYPEITIQHNNAWAVGEYIEIALFQLEVGSVATPFEHRSYGEELALCQRYYTKSYGSGITPGTNTFNGCVGRHGTASTSSFSTGEVFVSTRFTVEMRATPTVTAYDISGNINKTTRTAFQVADYDNENVSVVQAASSGCGFNSSSGTSAATLSQHYTADAEL